MPNTEIVPYKPNQEAEILDEQPELPREDKFVNALMVYDSITEAGIAAGYSKSYAETHLRSKLKQPKFIEKVRKAYNGQSIALLSKLSQINIKVVETCLNDIDCVPKFERTLKHVRQSAGVEAPDDHHNTPMIQVENIQNLLVQVHNDS